MPSTHTHTEKKERKLRGDLSVATLQIVLKEKKKEKEKKEKETKTCGVFLDSACGCCKKGRTNLYSVLSPDMPSCTLYKDQENT